MKTARKQIANALEHAKHPVVLSSFGKDSMLLLALVREIRNVPVLWFRPGFDEAFARTVIRDWDLTVVSYPPADIYALQDGNNTTLIHEYAFGADRLPLAVDVAPGTKCSLRNSQRLPTMHAPWDLILTGYKDCDSHWLVRNTPPLFRDVTLAGARVVTPLSHLSDDAVIDALNSMHLSFTINDELPICTACYTSTAAAVHCPDTNGPISVASWDRTAALESFRTRFHLGGTHGS